MLEEKFELHIMKYLQLSQLLQDRALESYQTTIINVDSESGNDAESVMNLLKSRVLVEASVQATLVLFPSEESQCRALSLIRNCAIDSVKVKPFFFNDYKHASGDFVENIRCGILVGSFNISSPLNIFYGSLSDIYEIVQKISPPGSQIAFISGSPAQITCMSSRGLNVKATYYGTAEEVNVLENVIQQSCSSSVKVIRASKEVDNVMQQSCSSSINVISASKEVDSLSQGQLVDNIDVNGQFESLNVFKFRDESPSIRSVFPPPVMRENKWRESVDMFAESQSSEEQHIMEEKNWKQSVSLLANC